MMNGKLCKLVKMDVINIFSPYQHLFSRELQKPYFFSDSDLLKTENVFPT